MNLAALVAQARAVGATVVELAGATIIVVPSANATQSTDDHLSLEEARALGKFKTTRPIRDAARAGEVRVYGKERTRTVRRGEFLAWLESRCSTRPTAGPDDADLDRRIVRLAAR
jgi:hypothetical protein